jgi:hypothetical protein
VVEVHADDGWAGVIGGNVFNSVSESLIPVDAQGRAQPIAAPLAGGGQEPAAVMGRPMLILGKLLLGPLLLAQAKRLRKTALRLPEAAGRAAAWSFRLAGRRWPRRCVCWWWVTLRPPGSGEHQGQALAQPLARQLAARTGHPVAWQLVAQSGVNSLEALDLLGRHGSARRPSGGGPGRERRHLADEPATRWPTCAVRAPDGGRWHIVSRACRPCTCCRWHRSRCAGIWAAMRASWTAPCATGSMPRLPCATAPCNGRCADGDRPIPSGHGQYAQWARMSAEIIESEFLRHQPVTESV